MLESPSAARVAIAVHPPPPPSPSQGRVSAGRVPGRQMRARPPSEGGTKKLLRPTSQPPTQPPLPTLTSPRSSREGQDLKYKTIAANVGVKFSVIAFTTYGGWGEEFRNKYVEPYCPTTKPSSRPPTPTAATAGRSSTARRLLSVMSPL
eukprot:scaffold11510_cov84-Isochrysis_galbana.AAC.2